MTVGRERMLEGEWTYATLTDRLLAPLQMRSRKFNLLWGFMFLGFVVEMAAILYTFLTGIGTWGNNIPIAWAFAITNFVWWIGIGHAGTFISAILLLLEQSWRGSLNRIAEGMTLFALVQAATFPILHLGRPWFFYWLIPYPATMKVWPQFISTLTWDVAAVFTYTTVSVLFWYLGLIPDLASARDRAHTLRKKRIYGFFALGWRGSARHWRHYRYAQLLLGGLATPLVLSVHSIVSMDFAIAKLPGWHSPIFPPYFVAGAIFSGFAMVITLVIPVRAFYGLQNVITERHLDLMAKLTLITGLIVTYSYCSELYISWYSADTFERWMAFHTRMLGPYAWVYWGVIFCNVVAPQTLWFKKFRSSPWLLWIVSIVIQVGMWSERFMLIVTSLHQDYLPSSWDYYTPTVIDGAILLGSIGFFFFLCMGMLKYVPFIPITETKDLFYELRKKKRKKGEAKEEPHEARAAG